jgi:hypothetical protein
MEVLPDHQLARGKGSPLVSRFQRTASMFAWRRARRHRRSSQGVNRTSSCSRSPFRGLKLLPRVMGSCIIDTAGSRCPKRKLSDTLSRSTCNPRRSRSAQPTADDAPSPIAPEVLLNPRVARFAGQQRTAATQHVAKRLMMIWRLAAVRLDRRVEEEPIIKRPTR